MITGMKNIVVFVTDLARAKRFYVEQLKLPLAQESMTMMELAPPGGAPSVWPWPSPMTPGTWAWSVRPPGPAGWSVMSAMTIRTGSTGHRRPPWRSNRVATCWRAP